MLSTNRYLAVYLPPKVNLRHEQARVLRTLVAGAHFVRAVGAGLAAGVGSLAALASWAASLSARRGLAASPLVGLGGFRRLGGRGPPARVGDGFGLAPFRRQAPCLYLITIWLFGSALTISSSKLTNSLTRDSRSKKSTSFQHSCDVRRTWVPANIVEGTQREHPKESLHFCSIASASLAEVGYGLHASHRLGYLSTDDYEQFELKIRRIAAPLKGLMATYRRGETLATQRKPIPARAKRAHPAERSEAPTARTK